MRFESDQQRCEVDSVVARVVQIRPRDVQLGLSEVTIKSRATQHYSDDENVVFPWLYGVVHCRVEKKQSC